MYKQTKWFRRIPFHQKNITTCAFTLEQHPYFIKSIIKIYRKIKNFNSSPHDNSPYHESINLISDIWTRVMADSYVCEGERQRGRQYQCDLWCSRVLESSLVWNCDNCSPENQVPNANGCSHDYLKEDDCYPVIVSDQGTDTCGSCWKRVLVVLNSMHGEFIARGEDIKIHTCCWPLENKILKCIVKGNGRICELWKIYEWEVYMASYDNILIHTFVGKYLDYLRIYWRL